MVSPGLFERTPQPLPLLVPVATSGKTLFEQTGMDVRLHLFSEPGIHDAANGDARGHARIGEDVVDARTVGVDQGQVGKQGEASLRVIPGDGRGDVIRRPVVRPDP